ncbi:MAG TPA: LCP family protein [Streptosporangiaceae bacterium]|jgi:LCP family protein required for cell wall assembly|nr:LCP family protein [Streptosporangiaceae bacterium]
MNRIPGKSRWAGRAGYSLSCAAAALVLVVSGSSYFLVRDVASIGSSHAIVSGPSVGAQNILLMGLESRTDWAGNILPDSILNALHSGSRQAVENGTGGNDTNTLILIHIPAGGRKAVGFSVPRDDWVSFAGMVGPQQAGKIDQAYGVSMYYEQQKLRAQNPGMSQDQLAFLGNEAGRTAAVATVEQLTGVHIDHFAEVNLDGFYELAKVLGGVEVCLNHAVSDPYSGADFRAGYQHLDARQALAFVRQRHGLPNGDLDRTHRQQAFLDSVMHQLRAEGVLSDLTKMRALLSVAKQYVITDAGWNLLDFSTQMRSLTSGNLVFRTLPIQGYATIDGQDANAVNPASIKAIVHAAFSPQPAPRGGRSRSGGRATPVTVDVLNGGNTTGLAARDSAALTRAGYRAGKVGNTSYRTATAIVYGPGVSASAGRIASLFGVTATASSSVAAGHVEVLLGADATTPISAAAAVGSPSPAPSSVIPSTGPQGGAVTAKDGIPCVN